MLLLRPLFRYIERRSVAPEPPPTDRSRTYIVVSEPADGQKIGSAASDARPDDRSDPRGSSIYRGDGYRCCHTSVHDDIVDRWHLIGRRPADGFRWPLEADLALKEFNLMSSFMLYSLELALQRRMNLI